MEDREVWGLFEAIDIVFDNISTVKDHRSAVTYLEIPLRQKQTASSQAIRS
jgi:hypothetical protein